MDKVPPNCGESITDGIHRFPHRAPLLPIALWHVPNSKLASRRVRAQHAVSSSSFRENTHPRCIQLIRYGCIVDRGPLRERIDEIKKPSFFKASLRERQIARRKKKLLAKNCFPTARSEAMLKREMRSLDADSQYIRA